MYKKIALKNGIRALLVPQKESLTTTVLTLVAAGSKYEVKEQNGISHFLEHLCFKGTKRRPSALAITSELDGLGAEYNAFTGEEFTGYHAKAESRHAERLIDLIADMYANPVFDASEIEKEKGVIIEELNMYEDLPMRRVQEVWTELLYGDQPAGWPIGGKKEIIRSLTRDQIVQYRGSHYVAPATAVIIAGKFDETGATEALEKGLGGVHDGEKGRKLATRDEQNAPAVAVKFKEVDQTHLILGCRAYHVYDDRRFALGVLADILGGGMSSRLFQRIRDKMGAAYYVRAGVDTLTDHGYLAVSAGVDHAKLNDVIKAILEEMNRVKSGDLPEEELQRAKDHLSGGMVIGLETSDALASYYGGQEVLDREILTPDQALARIRKVTKEEVLGAANDIFVNNKLNLALIGPQKDPVPFQKILTF